MQLNREFCAVADQDTGSRTEAEGGRLALPLGRGEQDDVDGTRCHSRRDAHRAGHAERERPVLGLPPSFSETDCCTIGVGARSGLESTVGEFTPGS